MTFTIERLSVKVVNSSWNPCYLARYLPSNCGKSVMTVGFKVEPLLMLSDEQWDNKAANPSIIRHHAKIRSIQANALMIHEAALEHGTFTNMVADWPRSVRPSPTVLVTIESVRRHCSRVILYRQWRLSS